jgi:hypothetical protein
MGDDKMPVGWMKTAQSKLQEQQEEDTPQNIKSHKIRAKGASEGGETEGVELIVFGSKGAEETVLDRDSRNPSIHEERFAEESYSRHPR